MERFNPVFAYLQQAAREPKFIETHRLSPFPARSTDVGVVLDLMIHDLDVVLAFVRSPVAQVDASGVSVLSSSEDIANARIRFENGCVANITASRISPEKLRKIRVFSAGEEASYISLDYRAQEGFIYRVANSEETPSSFWVQLLASRKKDFKVVSEFAGRKIVREPVPIDKDEPLCRAQAFRRLRPKQTRASSQWGFSQRGSGAGAGDHGTNSGRLMRHASSGR